MSGRPTESASVVTHSSRLRRSNLRLESRGWRQRAHALLGYGATRPMTVIVFGMGTLSPWHWYKRFRLHLTAAGVWATGSNWPALFVVFF